MEADGMSTQHATHVISIESRRGWLRQQIVALYRTPLWPALLFGGFVVNTVLLVFSVQWAVSFQYSLRQHLDTNQSLWPWWYWMLELALNAMLTLDLVIRFMDHGSEGQAAAHATVAGTGADQLREEHDAEARLADDAHSTMTPPGARAHLARFFWIKQCNVVDLVLVIGCWVAFAAASVLEVLLAALLARENGLDDEIDALAILFIVFHLARDLMMMLRLILLLVRGVQMGRARAQFAIQARRIQQVMMSGRMLGPSDLEGRQNSADEIAVDQLDEPGTDAQDDGLDTIHDDMDYGW